MEIYSKKKIEKASLWVKKYFFQQIAMSTHKATEPLAVFPFSWSYTNFLQFEQEKTYSFLHYAAINPAFCRRCTS